MQKLCRSTFWRKTWIFELQDKIQICPAKSRFVLQPAPGVLQVLEVIPRTRTCAELRLRTPQDLNGTDWSHQSTGKGLEVGIVQDSCRTHPVGFCILFRIWVLSCSCPAEYRLPALSRHSDGSGRFRCGPGMSWAEA